MADYSITQLTEKTGLPRRTIHFYVQQGLVPPPAGAGVGTRYSDVHLLSLQLIPILRDKGLKLDEIREIIRNKDERALQDMAAQHERQSPSAAPLPVSQPFSHYMLPAGMTLIVPAALSPAERKKLNELLKLVNTIFER